MHAIFLALMWAGVGGADPDQPVTSQDLVTGYRDNIAKFPRLRVAWAVRDKVLPAAREANDAHVKFIEAEATKEGISAEEKSRLLKFAEERRSFIFESGMSDAVHDFWTDRKRFQIRSSLDDPNWVPADDAVTVGTLPTTYQRIRIVSFVPSIPIATRVWSGFPRNGFGQGQIRKGMPGDTVVGEFPPLLVPNDSWAKRAWHPIDQFFFRNPEKIKIIDDTGRDGPDGTVIAEIRTEKPVPPYLNAPKKLRSIEITKAWISTKQGCVPTRMEWSYAWLSDETLIGGAAPPPYMILEIQKIDRVGDGFYPGKLTTRRFQDHPKIPRKALNADQILAGDFLKIPLVVFQEIVWEMIKIEADQPMSDDMFALKFPDRTSYFDEVRGKGGITGMSDADIKKLEHDRAANAFRQQPATRPKAKP